MLRGNRTERRGAENKALVVRAETGRTQIANLEGILQHMKEHHRKDKRQGGLQQKGGKQPDTRKDPGLSPRRLLHESSSACPVNISKTNF